MPEVKQHERVLTPIADSIENTYLENHAFESPAGQDFIEMHREIMAGGLEQLYDNWDFFTIMDALGSEKSIQTFIKNHVAFALYAKFNDWRIRAKNALEKYHYDTRGQYGAYGHVSDDAFEELVKPLEKLDSEYYKLGNALKKSIISNYRKKKV